MRSDPRCVVLVAILVTVLSETAVAAPSAESVADNVAVAAPAIDRWRGSGIDSDFDGDGYATPIWPSALRTGHSWTRGGCRFLAP